eukprot:scaffold5336_cov97-Isochrysis_galbana.AAC.3
MAAPDDSARIPIKPSGLRLADLAVSWAKASTESCALPSALAADVLYALIPDDALTELPPVRFSLSISTTCAPASSSRRAVHRPAQPEPRMSASGMAEEARPAPASAMMKRTAQRRGDLF